MDSNAVVLVTDRLGCGYLGPYGNTWIETPAWNRLAAQATLFETSLIDSPDILQLYRSYWHGRHSLAAPSDQNTPSLTELLGDKQVQSWLVTDERLVAEQSEAQGFNERVVLPPGDDRSAEVMEETQLARVFATVLDVVQQARSPFLVWVHTQAMQAPWDAPYHLRTQFVEEEDPDPPDFTQPPEIHLTGDYDPDVLLGVQHAYAAQVVLLDSCLDILLDSLWSSSLCASTALLATAARGFPVGEHRYVGRAELPVFGELLQVPWMIWRPESVGASCRVQQMVQPPDMYTTLANWFGVTQPETAIWGRNLLAGDVDDPATPDQLIACCAHDQQRAIRVPGWFMRSNDEQDTQLYAKPDDRWEFNEISNRCRDVVDELTELFSQFKEAACNHDRRQLPQLPDTLLQGVY